MWEGWVQISDRAVQEGLSDDLCADLKDLLDEKISLMKRGEVL